MKALCRIWQQLSQRYAALSRREQVFVALAMILGPLLIGNTLLLDPQWGRSKAIQANITTQSATLATLQAQLTSLQAELSLDPDAEKKAQLAALDVERQKLDGQLRELGTALVRPEEMNGLLAGLLARQQGLRLISLKTLAPQSVLRDKEGGKEGEKSKPVERAFDLYRHGVEIRLEGGYGQLQAYLAQLEGLPQRLLWGPLSYRVIDYPRSELTLTVYTLSPDKTWLTL